MYARIFRHFTNGSLRTSHRRTAKRTPSMESLEGRQLMSVGPEFTVDAGNKAFKVDVANATSSNGSSVVVWSERVFKSNGQFADSDIRAQRYDANGNKSGAEIFVAGKVGVDETEPSVAMDSTGKFVVSWTETEANGDTNVLAHKYSATGVPINGIVQVGVGTFREHQSTVAIDPAGNFVVAYTRDTNNNNPDVFAKRYNSASQLLGVVTVAGTELGESRPSIAMSPNGRFDVAYQVAINSSDNDVYVALFNSTGGHIATKGIAFSGALEEHPRIAMDSSSNAVVAYQVNFDVNNVEVHAARVSSSATVGTTVNIGRHVDSFGSPSVAMQPNGAAYTVAYTKQFNGLGSVVLATVSTTTNKVTHIDELNTVFYPAISAQGTDGFFLTYESLAGADLNDHILGRRGSFKV